MTQRCEAIGCKTEVEEINIESWETTGKILCEDCAEEEFERASREEYPDPRTDADWKRHAE